MMGEGEHFCEKTGLSKRAKIPTEEDVRKEKNSILPPEKRAVLPHGLASSDLPDKFLANVPPILLKK